MPIAFRWSILKLSDSITFKNISSTNNIYNLQQYHGNIIQDLVLKPMHSILRDIYIKHDKIQPELGEYQNVCRNYKNLSSIKPFFMFDLHHFLKER